MVSMRTGMAVSPCVRIGFIAIVTGPSARHGAKFICYAPAGTSQADLGARRAMLTLFYFLVIEQILQGLYNLWDGLAWLRLAQRRAGTHSGFYAPRVALFCPVKGAEPGLEQNISSLISFDYSDYEIFFAMA